MRNLCFPCLSASSVSNFEDQGAQVLEVKNCDTSTDGDLRKPTGAEYSKEAAKEFLKVLEAVAQEIPIPGVGAAVKIATNLIQACEESHATLKKAEALKLRIKTLVTVVVNELKEKKAEEIREKLMEDIDALQSEFKYIKKKLDEIASQHALLVVIFRSLNEEKVQICMNRLDSLLERFTIARHIDHANLLDRLEKEIIGFHSAQKETLAHIHDMVANMNVTMEDVRAVLKTNQLAAGSSAGAPAAVPTNTDIICGRDALISDLVAHFTSVQDPQRRHACILGPGGMGKTSTALAVMAHSDVKRRFPDGHRIWVPCVKATSTAIFLDTLASSLGIERLTGNIIDRIFSTLKAAGPLVLLLDNFETPWNIDGGRIETERILSDIDQLSDITLFVTIRSSAPPCRKISWHTTDLRAVDAAAAQQIYSNIYPDSSVDPQLPELLQRLGHMPLAITLMATSASLSGLSAKSLMAQYDKIGPTMLSQGTDTEHSLDICISLSVESLPMKRNPEAEWLLMALSMLPVGTTYDTLTTWWARNLRNLTGALQILRETALVERKDSMLSILPVIQRYILDPSRFKEDVRASMITSACDFLERHKSSPGEHSHREHSAALAAEEGNLEAVLLQSVVPSTKLLNALLVLAEHQASTRPRRNIIIHALSLALNMGDKSAHARALSCYGSICSSLSSCHESRQYYMDAREIFLSVSDAKQAANCLLACVSTYQYDDTETGEYRDSVAVQVESEFQSISDTHGIANCWFIRGITAIQHGNLDTALSLLRRARDRFTELEDVLKSAECSDMMAWCYYRREDFEQAKFWSETAVQQFERAGPSNRYLDAILLPGFIHIALGTHAVGLQSMVQFLERSKAFGGPLYIALALEQIGVTWMQMEKMEDAREAFEEALEVFPAIPSRNDHDRCHFWLRKLENPKVIPTSLEWETLRGYYPPRVLKLLDVAFPL